MKRSTFEVPTREDVTRVDSRPARPSVPRAIDDEESTTLFAHDASSPAIVATRAVPPPPPSRRSDERRRSSFPEPPRDRPRVFERPQRADVTTLRPSHADERTELRPQAHAPIAAAPVAAAPVAAAPVPLPEPIPSRPSLVPSTITIPPSAGLVAPSLALLARVKLVKLGRVQVGAIAFAAVLAPVVILAAALGGSDAPARASASMSPAITEASVFLAQSAPAPVVAAAPATPAQPIAQPSAPVVVADAAPTPPAAPRAALPPPPRPAPPPTAFAAAPRPAAPRPVVAAAPAPAPRPAKKPGPTELPDAQAADALARAQLEAALR